MKLLSIAKGNQSSKGIWTVDDSIESVPKSTDRTQRCEDLRIRTKQFALRAIKLVEWLPRGKSAEIIGRQLLRSATSVGANYRAAQRARSKAEFRAKLGIVEEECDESSYWLELLHESGIVKLELLENLIGEANEITAMIVASIQTART